MTINEVPAILLSRNELRDRVEKLSVIIYIRVSTDRPDMKSPEDQEWICREYCRVHNIRVIDVEIDLGLSGSDFTKRKVGEITERVRNGEANRILVWKYHRFGRNFIKTKQHLETLREAGGDLISATEDLGDTTSAHGMLILDIILALAENQLNQIREGWQTTHSRRLRNQLPHSGQPRFGYKRCEKCRKSDDKPRSYAICENCNGVFEKDAERAKALEDAYLMYVRQNKGFIEIARVMLARGIRSIKGYAMNDTQWREVLDSGFGAGLLRRRADKKITSHHPDNYLWYPGAHKAVIDQAVFVAYVEKRRIQADPGTRTSSPKHALSSLTRCYTPALDGEPCKRSMIAGKATQSNGKVRTFECKEKGRHLSGKTLCVKMDRVEKIVRDWLLENARGEQQLQIHVERIAKAEKSENALPEAKKALRIYEAERARVYEAYKAGLISLKTFTDDVEPIDANIEIAQDRVAMLLRSVQSNRVPAGEIFASLAELWDQASPSEKQRLIATVIDHVKISPPTGSRRSGCVIEIVPFWADDKLRAPKRQKWRV